MKNELNIKLSPNRINIIREIKNKPNITAKELMDILHLGSSTIENNIAYLKKNKFIVRVGTDKKGYWKMLK